MGITKSRVLLTVCVAIVIIIAVLFLTKDDDKPKADSTPQGPVSVYPQRGFTEAVVKNDNGEVSCDLKTVASVLLADNGGTISNNDLLITSKWDKDSVLVTFKGTSPFVSGYVVGSKSIEPFNIPATKVAEGTNSPSLLLDTKDFSKSGAFKDIYLCGGGM